MITLSKSGNTVTFTFDENSGYLQNGTIDVPVNSLSLITDESDMATFRKSASNDIFISARYEEFGMSKAELEAWYKANMVSSGGGGGTGGTTPEEVQQMIDQSISGKTDTSAFTSYTTSTNSRLGQDEEVSARALNDLDERKLDASAYTPVDLSDYYTTAQTDSKISEAVSGKQDTLTAGRGIDISANTISFDLPISAGTGTNSLIMSGSGNTASGDYSVAYGKLNSASGECSTANGNRNTANNFAEFSIGQKNVSRTEDSSAFGHSGNTLFSVGNGIINEGQGIDANHNAFEVRGNGEIYISDTNAAGSYYQKPMINLQDTLNGKQDTLVSGTNIKTINNISLLGSGNIDIQGGGGSGTCTVDETTIYDIYSGAYSNDALDMRVNYVVLDYTGDKTLGNASVDVNFRDANNNNYVNQYINFDYSTSSYTLNDQSQAEYIDITYDPTIEDFKIAVASAYTSTVFVGRIGNFWGNYIKVPFYTISSGSPCTVIENDVTSAISSVRDGVFKALRTVSVTSQKTQLNIYSETIGGASNSFIVKFDEIDGSNNTLKPDIYVGLGTSGWTEIDITQSQCNASELKGTKFRVTYDYSEFNAYNMNLQLSVSWAGNMQNDSITFDEQTQQPSLQSSTFTGATVDWNASTKELVITYPDTIDNYGELVPVNIERFENYACQFGQTISKLESYGEDKQALKPYVQDTRAALGGLKLQQVTQAQYDALVSGGTVDNSTIYYIVN